MPDDPEQRVGVVGRSVKRVGTWFRFAHPLAAGV
jgi:hypothetical protein